jgi:phosphate transport system permease protein
MTDLTRFQPSRFTLVSDRFMNHFIKVGGLGVIAAVMGIFVFIFIQILPLFRGANVQALQTVDTQVPDAIMLGVDQWTELPFVLDESGTLHFIAIPSGERRSVPIALPGDAKASAYTYVPATQQIVVGTDQGGFSIVDLNYKANFGADETRTIEQQVQVGKPYSGGVSGEPVLALAYCDGESIKVAVLVQEVDGKPVTHAVTLKQKRSLMGAGKIKVAGNQDLSAEIAGRPRFLRVGADGQVIVVATKDTITYLRLESGNFVKKQEFLPFAKSADQEIASMNLLLGGNSLVLSNADGENRIFSLYMPAPDAEHLFGHTKSFESLPAGASAYAASQRNKSFLVSSGSTLSLRHGTTEAIRWQHEEAFAATQVALSSKHDRILALDGAGKLHLYELRDPHPEAGIKAFFGKVSYEGAASPDYVWQSTGGSDEFEPKLSMIPLIVGSIKGTVFAMLFAIPIALLAALYTSQFQHPRFRAIVKPTMETMASIPSVVLGFLAALWLAPIVENRVPTVLVFVTIAPLAAMLIGYVWTRLPPEIRVYCKPGYEFLVFLPMLVACVYFSEWLGPILESVAFVVTDPETGARTADFRLWWPQFTGDRFEQRNALIVGFAMGFAVIPIIFTIAEDSLSNVPQDISSAALALGASRWQTAFRVVLPTAAAGIFSAVIIGLGRAVGETMIVLMATGNTPIMDMSIFTGMRTLSANIAVELPEAPHGGTLYRALFLGAMLLFAMTFVLNTVAELLRQHLRNKYKTV